jgi:N-dimethylarginine dimethylaminohydrolase
VSLIFTEWAKKYRTHLVSTGGHSDSVFCPVAEGLIITTHWLTDYSKTFPGWEVFKLPKETFGTTTGGPKSWWLPDSQYSNNSLFAQHIEQKALDWVGNYQETQFSVNMLVIDNKTILAVNQNPKLTEFLTKKGFEVIVADFRCKEFWDGGMHCLTCDITREGNLSDYFPNRPLINYLDWIV